MRAAVRIVLLACAAWAAGACFSACWAQERIGQAAVVRREVTRVELTRAFPVAAGEDVVRSEVIRTGAASSARLAFIDDTSLAIGPVSTVTLDNFVYAPASTYRRAVFDLGRGLFRFLTGASNKRAYEIVTPQATIGVRGTVVDALVTRTRTLVSLQEGSIVVCPRAAGEPVEGGPGCVILSDPAQNVVVSGGRARLTPATWSFAGVCDRDESVCGAPTYARSGVCVAGAAAPIGCVDPDLAATVRRRSLSFAQSGASATSPPYPPRRDRVYLIPGAENARATRGAPAPAAAAP